MPSRAAASRRRAGARRSRRTSGRARRSGRGPARRPARSTSAAICGSVHVAGGARDPSGPARAGPRTPAGIVAQRVEVVRTSCGRARGRRAARSAAAPVRAPRRAAVVSPLRRASRQPSPRGRDAEPDCPSHPSGRLSAATSARAAAQPAAASSPAPAADVRQAQGVLLLLPKLKLLTTSGTMLVSIARLRAHLGLEVRGRLRRAAVRPRDGPRDPAAPRGRARHAPIFIPFLGAVVWAKPLGGDAPAEARVGLAGPVLGTLGAALHPARRRDRQRPLPALAFTGFFLNLFNLAPILPLDGGRAMAAMSPWMWLVGLRRDGRRRDRSRTRSSS